MPWKKTLVATAVTAAVLVPEAVQAQANCGNRDSVVDKLSGKYGESFSGGGLQNADHLFEVWLSEEKGTWTILMTRADGTSCIMAAGTNWRDGLKIPAGIPG
ncbi:hypothetical protein N9L47_06040 [Rhodobacteraceae bacterium]|nr:hypothetical protein [Paracoccaceae bacterium]